MSTISNGISSPRLAGIGTALPPHSATQSDTAEVHALLSGLDERRTRTLRALYRRSGVKERWSVVLNRRDGPLLERQDLFAPGPEGSLGPATSERMACYAEWAPRLATEAGVRALTDAGIDARRVTHLVTVSCTGFVAPGIDAGVVEGLGLAPTVERTHVGFMGCHGALNGLRVARGFAAADPHAVVLVAAVELCSLHYAYSWNPDLLVANSLFGDGAGAVVITGDGIPAPNAPGWRIRSSGTILFGSSRDDMTWRIGDHGFLMTLSPRVPDLLADSVRPWLDEWLGAHGLALDEVATWAIHPGGPRILEAVERAAGLDRSATDLSREVLAGHGNMSSATVLFLLERLRREGAALPAVALAFGPGLAAEGMLVVGDEGS